MAITPDRLCLGLLDSLMWARKLEDLGKATPLRKKKPLEEKESRRWIDGYRHVCDIAETMPNTQCVYMADRESDIYELFIEDYECSEDGNESTAQQRSADWLVRASQDRALAEDEHISEALAYAEVMGITEFELPASHARSGQIVKQELKATKVKLRPPYRPDKKLEKVEITVISAQEKCPPKGMEAVTWVFLTNIEITSTEDIMEKIQWYLCRWQIEIYFRILKSGCQIEELQLEHIERLQPALAMYMIVAWRVLYLTMLGRECPELSCDLVFDTNEWQAIYLVSKKEAPPKEPPHLNEIMRMLASFGGFLGRKGDGEPAPKSIWIGLQRARDFVVALDAHRISQKA